MICCDFCPNVMHAACCGIDDTSSLGSMWSCPHHKCVTCGRKVMHLYPNPCTLTLTLAAIP